MGKDITSLPEVWVVTGFNYDCGGEQVLAVCPTEKDAHNAGKPVFLYMATLHNNIGNLIPLFKIHSDFSSLADSYAIFTSPLSDIATNRNYTFTTAKVTGEDAWDTYSGSVSSIPTVSAGGVFLKSYYNDATDWGFMWSAIKEVPASAISDKGKVLTVDSSGNAGWATPTVDQNFDPMSRNAQSGRAVAAALGVVNEVPASTSADEGKVLTVASNGDPAWDSPTQSDWNQTSSSEPDFIKNKPKYFYTGSIQRSVTLSATDVSNGYVDIKQDVGLPSGSTSDEFLWSVNVDKLYKLHGSATSFGSSCFSKIKTSIWNASHDWYDFMGGAMADAPGFLLDDIPATELEQLVGGIPLTHKAHRTGTTSTIATTSGPSLRIMLAGNDWVDGDKVGLEASIIAIKVK